MVKKYYMLGKQKVIGEKFIEYVKKYNHSEKGKATRAAYLAKHRNAVNAYNRKYLKKRRDQARRKGLCLHCFKIKRVQGRSTCEKCTWKLRRKHEQGLINGGNKQRGLSNDIRNATATGT